MRRLALNLGRYRDASAEWMAKPHGGSDADKIAATFKCECARVSCQKTVTMTLAEYEVVRRDPEQFFVAPSRDHVFPEVERILEATNRYFVVVRRTPDL